MLNRYIITFCFATCITISKGHLADHVKMLGVVQCRNLPKCNMFRNAYIELHSLEIHNRRAIYRFLYNVEIPNKISWRAIYRFLPHLGIYVLYWAVHIQKQILTMSTDLDKTLKVAYCKGIKTQGHYSIIMFTYLYGQVILARDMPLALHAVYGPVTLQVHCQYFVVEQKCLKSYFKWTNYL